MAYNINTKQQLFDYCKRRLGAPVVQINVTDDQIEDCFQETLTFWQIYHTDGSEKVYIKHKITGSMITLADATGWQKDDVMIGQTSLGADMDIVASVISVVNNDVSITIQTSKTGLQNSQGSQVQFIVGQTVKNSRTQTTTTITAISLGDIDTKSIPIEASVYGVTRLFPFSLGQGQAGAASLFNLQYQLRLHELGNLANVSLAYYVQTMTQLRTLDSILNGAPLFRFNRFQNKLVIDAYWGSTLNIDDWVLVEGYKSTDPDMYARAYGDPWIVKHLTATIKQNWGVNLKKFAGIQLIGGVSIDGQALYDEANAEKLALETDLINNGAPLEFQVG